METALMLEMPGRLVASAVVAGAIVGLVYTLSPLTVVIAPVLVAIVWFAVRGLPPHERRWVLTLMVLAIAVRLLAIGGLFLSTDHDKVVAGTLFGDESYYSKRSGLLASIARRAPVSPEDIQDAFEEIGDVAYLHLLAFIQVLVGSAPYGLRVLNSACYLLGVAVMYRLARRAYGGLPAAVGLAMLLFLPTLLAWSVSILKEAMLVMATSAVLAGAVAIARGPWHVKILAAAGSACAVLAVGALRSTGSFMAAGGVALGYLWHYVTAKPARALAAVVAVPVVALIVFEVPALHDPAMEYARIAAVRNRGHVFTAGFSYRLLDERLYGDYTIVSTMTDAEALRFALRAFVHFVVQPTPDNMRSWVGRAYLPEQLLWFGMLLVLPLGIRAGVRADRLFTMLLLGSAFVAAVPIALTGGNVGTLVRHRGMVIVLLSWVSALGFCQVAARLAAAARGPAGNTIRTSFDAVH